MRQNPSEIAKFSNYMKAKIALVSITTHLEIILWKQWLYKMSLEKLSFCHKWQEYTELEYT